MKTRTRRFAPSLLAAGASVALAAAAHAAPSPADPTGMADSDMLRLLTAYQKLGARPVASLTVAQARAAASMAPMHRHRHQQPVE